MWGPIAPSSATADQDAVARDVFRPAIAMGRGRVQIPPVFDADQVHDPGREPRARVESDERAQERLAVDMAHLFGRHRLQSGVDIVLQPRYAVAGVRVLVRRPGPAFAPADLVERIEAVLGQGSPLEVALRAADDAAVGQHPRVAPRAFGKRDLQLPVVIDQPSHAGNRAVGRDGDALARHQVRIVGPPERTGIRRAELREMKTVEDLAAGGDPVGFRRQLRRFDERLRALLPHPVAIPFRFAALDVDRVGPDFVDRRGVVLGFRIVLRRGLHARDGQRPARERLVGPEPRHAGPRRQLGGERRDGRDRTGQQRKSTHHAPQSSKSFTLCSSKWSGF